MKYNTIIIGGGPSGMISAITAARRGLKVCILEHQDRIGKKILSTGNGKCNLTNYNIGPDCYHSDCNEDYFSVIKKFPPEKIVEFFGELGMLTMSRNGYVYPRAEQASTVLDVLRNTLDVMKIQVFTDCKDIRIKYDGGKFKVSYADKNISSDKLILACGSKCAPKTGSDGSGYVLAKSFRHTIVPVIPALVQLICKENFYKELQGVRADAALKVTVDREIVATEEGELQLTGYGISGIPVFQISRTVKKLLDKKTFPMIHIDFARELSHKELAGFLVNSVNNNQDSELSQLLSGVLNKKLANVIAKECGMKPSVKCNCLTSDQIKRIVSKIKDFVVVPKDTNGFDNAQVCAGGVSLNEINLNTMESKIQPNLYFAGEILDVDGKCGGYNLTWAFASGKLAGDNQ